MNAWLIAIRPKTLLATIVPVLVGAACAINHGVVHAAPILAALIGALLIQIGTNLANDRFDFEHGADRSDRLGPTRVVQAGLLTPQTVGRAAMLAFALATLVGVYLTIAAGPVIVVVGVASILSGLAYSGGPFPLAYHGLGELFVMIFFGFVAVCGTAYVAAGTVPQLAYWASIPVGALASAILVVNNLRDQETDCRADKRTLAVRFGRRVARREYIGLLLVSYLVPVGLLLALQTTVWILLPWVTIPMAFRLIQQISTEEGRALNQRLEGTARLMLSYGIFFAIGLMHGAA